MKVFLWILSLSFLSLVMLSLGLSYLFFQFGFTRRKKHLIRRSKDIKFVDYRVFKTFEPWFIQQNPQDLWIKSKDGLRLHAYYFAGNDPQRLVILHHGYTSQGINMAMFAKFYTEQPKTAVLVLDMRAHGQSEGRYLGFGWLEKEDTRLWIETMNDLMGKPLPVILHGLSMGASTVLDLAANDCPAQVSHIISDSAFSDLNTQFKRQFKQIFHFPSFPLLTLGDLWCQVILGFSFKTASPIRLASTIKIPTLIIHGLKDMFVPYPMSNEIYTELKCPKKLIHYENAHHALNYPLNQKDYETQILSFIQENSL